MQAMEKDNRKEVIVADLDGSFESYMAIEFILYPLS